MKSFLGGMVLVIAMAAPVAAETRYDRTLEKAVIEIVVSKMGNIRGAFSYKQAPQLVVVPEAAPAAPVPIEPRKQASNNDGLMPAVERPVLRTIF
jgi:hypothetical protein